MLRLPLVIIHLQKVNTFLADKTHSIWSRSGKNILQIIHHLICTHKHETPNAKNNHLALTCWDFFHGSIPQNRLIRVSFLNQVGVEQKQMCKKKFESIIEQFYVAIMKKNSTKTKKSILALQLNADFILLSFGLFTERGKRERER